jgi:hypothetical protein
MTPKTAVTCTSTKATNASAAPLALARWRH